MIKFFRDVYRGAGYLEGYGYHPGNSTLFIIAVMCGIAGTQRGGIWGFIGGFLIGLASTSIPWMFGCRDRARGYDRDVERTAELLKKKFN